jgi:hypothetical protein
LVGERSAHIPASTEPATAASERASEIARAEPDAWQPPARGNAGVRWHGRMDAPNPPRIQANRSQCFHQCHTDDSPPNPYV